ncbi:MAG: glutathione S-transferase family protein [Alphaproteobacteria bacterium]|nr:glutathione S-transferase family protein [Alphaproteobacteria bacterium]
MKLYMVPLAPNPVKVMLYMAEREALGAGLPIEKIIVNTLKGKHKTPEHLARNPFGSLPVLEIDEGQYICESRAIIDYLEDAFRDHPLFSADLKKRARQRDMERICDVRLAEYLGSWVHAYKSPIGLPPNAAQARDLEERMQPALNFLNDVLADGREFVCGDVASPADCTLQAFLNFMRFTGKNLITEYEHITRWDTVYRARDIVAPVITI